MIFTETPLKGAYVVELEKREDERGFFARYYCELEYAEHGLSTSFVQINNSLAVEKATLRGMHYQLAPRAETKVVRCIRGALWDCIIDLRVDSPTSCRHFAVELTADNRTMLYVPKGFGHGFITLTDNTEALYLVDEFYSPEQERGIRYDDPAFNIEWPLQPAVVSDKDRQHPEFDTEYHLVS